MNIKGGNMRNEGEITVTKAKDDQVVRHFINLSNGIEAIGEYGLSIDDIRFIRIQSTACEQKRWKEIINDLSPDFLISVSIGHHVRVYDYGAKKDIPRAIWQGIEWVKYVLFKRWAGEKYQPIGRAKSMAGYFEEQYFKLDRRTKKKLDYYGKFFQGKINIGCITSSTSNDGDTERQRLALDVGGQSETSCYTLWQITK